MAPYLVGPSGLTRDTERYLDHIQGTHPFYLRRRGCLLFGLAVVSLMFSFISFQNFLGMGADWLFAAIAVAVGVAGGLSLETAKELLFAKRVERDWGATRVPLVFAIRACWTMRGNEFTRFTVMYVARYVFLVEDHDCVQTISFGWTGWWFISPPKLAHRSS